MEIKMRRSCFIFGCGRSGTSLTAGLLAQEGYFMGSELYPADEGNPKGYFEDREINGINEGLLAQILPGPRRNLTDKVLGRRPHSSKWTRWLAELSPEQKIPCSAKLADRIKLQVARRPFCFKDPRFCYTLATWRKFALDAAILCVFRHPEASAASLVKEAERTGTVVDGTIVDNERALRIWRMMYGYALDVHYPAGGDWLFLHYDQLVEGSAYQSIEQLLEVKVNREFADARLRRSFTPATVRADAAQLYRRLCALARFGGD
jgi:hypothetical protein